MTYTRHHSSHSFQTGDRYVETSQLPDLIAKMTDKEYKEFVEQQKKDHGKAKTNP